MKTTSPTSSDTTPKRMKESPPTLSVSSLTPTSVETSTSAPSSVISASSTSEGGVTGNPKHVYVYTGLDNVMMRWYPRFARTIRVRQPASCLESGDECQISDDDIVKKIDPGQAVRPPWHNERSLRDNETGYSFSFKITEIRKSQNSTNWRLFVGTVNAGDSPLSVTDEYTLMFKEAPVIVRNLQTRDQIVVWDLPWHLKESKGKFDPTNRFEIMADFNTYYVVRAPKITDGVEF